MVGAGDAGDGDGSGDIDNCGGSFVCRALLVLLFVVWDWRRLAVSLPTDV